ncbi:MAG: hypothetical protein V2A69_16030 [Pseudomonadota bacterium]
MFHCIPEVYNYLEADKKSKDGLLLATGPSADKFALTASCLRVIIGINRAIVLYKHFDFLFIDGIRALALIIPYIEHTKYIVMPIWSCGLFNINNDVVQKYQEKILFYAWSLDNWDFLNVSHSLNDFQLYINWGCTQSAIHFAKRIGLQSLEMIGCDGGPSADGQLYSSRVTQVFPEPGQARFRKQSGAYKRTSRKTGALGRSVGIELINNFMSKAQLEEMECP